jgi:hypothetical protein
MNDDDVTLAVQRAFNAAGPLLTRYLMARYATVARPPFTEGELAYREGQRSVIADLFTRLEQKEKSSE